MAPPDEPNSESAERELQRLADAAEQSSDAIISIDLDNRVRHWNRGAERLFGLTADEAIGLTVDELNTLTDGSAQTRAMGMDSIARALTGRRGHLQITVRNRRDGQARDLAVALTPWRVDGRVVGVTTILSDVTERTRAEQTTARLAAIVDGSDDAIIGKTLDGTITSWNPSAERIYGYAPTEAVGRHISMLAVPGGRAEFDQIMTAVSRGEVVRHLETTRRRKDGRLIDVSVTVSPIRDRGGEIVGAATVARDISERRRAEQERIAMLEETVRAEAANREKSEFLARMSHELRTPLNSIIGFSQLMELDGLAPRQQRHISLVLKAARHLLALIDQVLDIARIEVGHLAVSPEPVALADAITEALEFVLPLAAERGVTVDVDTGAVADDGHVIADRNRLRQVLLNLFSNAIKYNRSGGHVQISVATTTAGRVGVRVSDTGTGIPADQLPKLFEPFERLGAEQTEIEGTGLGLSLCKALLEAMGGTIEVETELGTGTTFLIQLAAAEAPGLDLSEPPADTHLSRLSAPGHRRRLLYVEDNLSNLTLVEQILERYSAVELLSAMQGTIGFELARQHLPDLIILDLHLPDISGIEVLKRLKSDEVTREIPVVMLTADPSRGRSDYSRLLGADRYLTKPLDVVAFIDVVAQHLALSDRNSNG